MRDTLGGTSGAHAGRVAVSAGVSITCASSPDAIHALIPVMEALWGAAGATPFQHPGWWVPWIAAFQIHEARVVVAWRGDRAAGALTVYRTLEAQGPVVRVLGAGNTDYLDAIVAAAADEATCDALAAWIDRVDGRIDWLDLPPDAALRRVLARCRRTIAWAPGARCPVVVLPRDPDEWRRSLPHGLARNLRRYARHLNAAGETSISRVQPADAEQGVDAFVGLHAARWRERGELGVLADPAVEAFHRASIPWLLRAGLARLYLMRHKGVPIAAQYVLVSGARAFSYLSGFHPSYSRFSPGALLMAHAIEDAIAAGCRTFDLLRGEEPYKALWATRVIDTHHATMAPLSTQG